MYSIYKQSSTLLFRRLTAATLIVQATLAQPALATAAFDSDVEQQTSQQQSTSSSPDLATPDTIPQANASNPIASPPSTPAESTPTYSIRLPQAVTGSMIPIIPTGRPHAHPGNPFMPSAPGEGTDHPLAWRATAEAIRQQPPNQAVQVTTFKSDFKSTYTNLLAEFESTGWSLSSLSLPAGHFLVRIPRASGTTRNGTSAEDAAAWLILAVTPLDTENTEVRVKIQSRHPSQFIAALNAVLQRCQLKSNGNQLL